MAIAIDARNAGANSAGATSITWTHTVTANTNGILVVHATTGSGTIKSITSITWNGTNLSNTVNGVAATQNDSSANVNANLWYLRAPETGSFDIVVTPNASCELTGGSSSWTGVDQLAPFRYTSPVKTQVSAGNNPTITINSDTGEVVIDSVAISESGDIGTLTPGANQNEISARDNGAGTSAGLNSDEAGAAAVTMSWALGNEGEVFAGAIVALSMRPSGTGQIAFVTSGGTTVGTAASTWSFVPGPSSMAGGGAIIVGVGCGSSAVTVSTITDNTTNLYLRAVARESPLPAAGAEIWYALGYSTASTRVSLTLSGNSSGSVAYAGFTGFSTGTPLGPTGSSGNSTLSTAHSITEVTSTSTGALMISFNRANVSTISPIRLASTRHIAWISTGVAVRTFGQFEISSVASTTTSPWTHGAAAGASGGCLFSGVHAIFYSTVVTGGGPTFYYGPGGFCLMGVQH